MNQLARKRDSRQANAARGDSTWKVALGRFCFLRTQAVECRDAGPPVVESEDSSKCCAAQVHRTLGDRVKHRLSIDRRPRDYLEYLSCRREIAVTGLQFLEEP